MTLRDQVARLAGVWEGTYTHFAPDGSRLDHFASRQETRLEGDRWFERIVYRWPDREEIHDFRAGFDESGERMIFDDADFHGQSFAVGDNINVFPYYWKSNPDRRIVETIVVWGGRRSRVWQTFDQGVLVRLTSIVERRLPDGVPAVWY